MCGSSSWHLRGISEKTDNNPCPVELRFQTLDGMRNKRLSIPSEVLCNSLFFRHKDPAQTIDVLKILRAQSVAETGGNYPVLMKTSDL